MERLREEAEERDKRIQALEVVATQVSTVVSLVKWFISPGVALIIILQILKLANIV